MPITLDGAVRAAAAQLSQSFTPLLDARILCQHVTGFDHGEMIAQGAAPLPDVINDQYKALITRRANGEPIAYLVGTKEFWGQSYVVTPDVLIPRADSETLVSAIASRREGARYVLDLGTGSGCLLGALMGVFTGAIGLGVDRSLGAACIAARNMQRLGFSSRTQIINGSWLQAVGRRFDIIVSNPPYIAPDEQSGLPVDVRDFEPAIALFSDEDGRADYRHLLAVADRALCPQGLFVLEIGDGQAGFLMDEAQAQFPTAQSSIVPDLAGQPRALVIDKAKR
ncbi:MAG: peptide chain release factor N(5)-glutamine methyltransferase [Pseudomonadota bacterium]